MSLLFLGFVTATMCSAVFCNFIFLIFPECSVEVGRWKYEQELARDSINF